MEHQNYEELSPVAHQNAGIIKNTYIDFYRQQQQEQKNGHDNTNTYETTQKDDFSAGVMGDYCFNAAICQNDNLDDQLKGTKTDNYITIVNQNANEKITITDGKQKATSHKRMSLENKQETINTRANSHREEGRQAQLTGARSALNIYGNIQQPINSIKQNTKQFFEKEGKIDNQHQNHQQLFQNNNGNISQQKRSLTKTQSQNKLHLGAHELISTKNGPNPDHVTTVDLNSMHNDKTSFCQDQEKLIRNRAPNQQHLQYGSNSNNQKWQLKTANPNLLSHISTKECTYCNNKTQTHSILPNNQCSAIYCGKDSLGLIMQQDLSKKYSTNRDYYNLKLINDLIYNENTHIVSIFKDYLILDDINEFLKRTYTQQETKVRLPKLCSFYDKYSQVFPNYVVLPESKYMFKNIQRKQKLIDEQYQIQEEMAKKERVSLMEDERLFNSKFNNSVYNLTDISMTKKQYEEQAKQIATRANRLKSMRIEEMKIDDLVDRFLMKDSESNIQLQTTAGLDFSGFTHQSTFIQEKSISIQQQQSSNGKGGKKGQKEVIQMQQNKGVSLKGQHLKKSSDKKQAQQQQQQTTSTLKTNSGTQKRSKVSLNQQKVGTYPGGQVPKLESLKTGITNGSQKNTPRLQQKSNNNHLSTNANQEQKNQISPATKNAVNNYLNDCQIQQQPQQHHNDHLSIKVNKMSSNNTMETPGLSSPQFNMTHKLLPGSTLSQQNNTNLSSTNQRHLRSQQSLVPTVQLKSSDITNLKKSTRLSGGPSNHNPQKYINSKKQNISPMPQQINQHQIHSQQQFQTQGSRNNIGSNSTQKSIKSITSQHTKYLSGGPEQYQRLLAMQQNSYATHETLHTNIGSSQKKPTIQKIQHQQDTYQKRQHDNVNEFGVTTGDDCDDAGIADERFASPEVGYYNMFNATTQDDNRKSISNGGTQYLMLSVEGDKVFQKGNNYDQIKKHLEQYITINQQQNTFDGRDQFSNSKKQYMMTKSSEKGYEQCDKGYNRNQMASSAASGQNESLNSRNTNNGNNSKQQFESLKQRIRGVFEGSAQQQNTSENLNKTPNKSSVHSKKSAHILQQNRMSIESKGDLMMMGLPQQQNMGSLSSTSANGRMLSFTSQSFNNNSANYRGITNLQQRKGSSHIKQQETSIENKRLSNNRQSFKELQMQQEQQQQKMMKRCATGKTLSINDINQHTFGHIQNQIPHQLTSHSNATTTTNPTFISNQHHNSKLYQTSNHHQQQNSIYQNSSQQAANTVRVMTPSYSLASLSKMISPTISTSPLTMTVTLNSHQNTGAVHSRKQVSKKSSNTHHQHNPSITSNAQQNYIISDKGSKIVSSKQNSQKTKTSSKLSQQQSKHMKTLQQSNSVQNFHQITPRGVVPQQQQQQLHPSQQQMLQQKYHPLQQESQNLSCTVSTENNSTAKAIESKHPKFMRTIEEYSTGSQHHPQYNTMLSAGGGHRKTGTGLTNSLSQPQLLEGIKHKHKISTVVNSNQASIKRNNNPVVMSLQPSASVSHFRSPTQNFIQNKKQKLNGKYV